MKQNEPPLFPAKVFIFDVDGFHQGPFATLNNEEDLDAIWNNQAVRTAFKAGLEIRIVDPGDSCVFHAKDATILFPEISKD